VVEKLKKNERRVGRKRRKKRKRKEINPIGTIERKEQVTPR